MITELFKSEQNSSSINNTSLSLILSLRVNDPTTDYETSIHDSSRIYNVQSEILSIKINNNDQPIESATSCLPPISAKQLEKIERRNRRHKLQREIVNIAKKTIKPAYKKRYITKDGYKTIMKKVVTKATYSKQLDQKWFDKTINAYVKKYRTV